MEGKRERIGIRKWSGTVASAGKMGGEMITGLWHIQERKLVGKRRESAIIRKVSAQKTEEEKTVGEEKVSAVTGVIRTQKGGEKGGQSTVEIGCWYSNKQQDDTI